MKDLPVAESSRVTDLIGLDKNGQSVKLPNEQNEIKTEVATLGSKVGDLSKLVTSEKEDLVKAINETYVHSGGGGGGEDPRVPQLIQDVEDIEERVGDRVATSSNMGYVILRKDKTFAEQVTKANTIYEIRYEFDLNGQTVTIPEGCTLKFEGGKVSNGTIVGNQTRIDAYNSTILEVNLNGSWSNSLQPNWFGAVGDNNTDDTTALRKALYFANRCNVTLYFPEGNIYKVTDSINYHDGAYFNISVRIKGCYPSKIGGYTPSKYGGIKVSDNMALFKNGEISGNMANMGIFGVRSISCILFDHCHLSNMVIEDCSICNFGVAFNDTGMASVSHIKGNRFLTCWWFSRAETRTINIIDSKITDNYINGGEEPNDNCCFSFANGNGSIISGNFVDYYRTIFYSDFSHETSSKTGNLPLSIGNQYQVFRYFYDRSSRTAVMGFTSESDVFNWIDPSKLEKLAKFTPIKKKIKISNVDTEFEIPPYIAFYNDTNMVSIKDIKVESYCKIPLFYLWGVTYGYKYTRFELSFATTENDADINLKTNLNDITKASSVYNILDNNVYYTNLSIDGVRIDADSLPNMSSGWQRIPIGLRVYYDGKYYTSKCIKEYGKSRNAWVDDFGNEYNKNKSGETTERPTTSRLVTGDMYFDTTINHPIWWNGSKWVDATGADV